MQGTTTAFSDHQVILCGLEVLRLITDRLDRRQDIDVQDVQVVLVFLHEVAHPCLGDRQEIRTLFGDLSRAPRTNETGEFVDLARSYTTLLADFFLTAPLPKPAPEIREAARRQAPTLRQLETKYTSPQCI